jgi:hypothetical protein
MSGRVAEQHCNVGGRENTKLKRGQDKPNKQSLGGKTERSTVMTESVSNMREMIIKSWGIKGRSSYNPSGHLQSPHELRKMNPHEYHPLDLKLTLSEAR